MRGQKPYTRLDAAYELFLSVGAIIMICELVLLVVECCGAKQ